MFCRSSSRSRPRSAGLVTPKLARRRMAGEGAFTLLEILVVLALMGLISGLLLSGSDTFLRAVAKDDVENTALNAIASARQSAVLAGRQLELHYDETARQLDWEEGRAVLTGEGDLRLLPAVRTSAVLVGGQAVEATLARVRFYADGTCDPFRLEIIRGEASQILTIDPWTCAVLAPEPASGSH
jgi:prepilin-type N-terminal cleavage/methylation domain-containing protein